MEDSHLIILRGNSGSGKTTVAKLLFDHFHADAMLVSQDVVRRTMLRVKDVPDNPAIELIYRLCSYGNQLNKIVILEGILRRDIYGDMLTKLISDFNGLARVYYFDIPFNETLRRHATKPNAHEFGEAEMRQWWRSNDVLGVKEEQIFNAEMSADDMLKNIVNDCTTSK
ncbi:kinase [Candidatus Saccharibacteria bacterium]|nr:kinase [Candidatus Saccharibacteria bacterium]